jgi:hypothetical protein
MLLGAGAVTLPARKTEQEDGRYSPAIAWPRTSRLPTRPSSTRCRVCCHR